MEGDKITFSRLIKECENLYQQILNNPNNKKDFLNEIFKIKRNLQTLKEEYNKNEHSDQKLLFILKTLFIMSLLLTIFLLFSGKLVLFLVSLILESNLIYNYDLVNKYSIRGTYDNEIAKINTMLTECNDALTRKKETNAPIEDENINWQIAQELLDEYLENGYVDNIMSILNEKEIVRELIIMLNTSLQTYETDLFKLLLMAKYEYEKDKINPEVGVNLKLIK